MNPPETYLLIGTKNLAKFNRYQRILSRYVHLTILSPGDLPVAVDICENGVSAQENARIKASAYVRSSGLPALGIDEALYVPALPVDQQPGVFVRRYAGKALSDEGLLNAFLEKARQLAPKDRLVKWRYAACLALPDGQMYEDECESLGRLIDQPRLPSPPGYPLSALIVDAGTGKTFGEMSPKEKEAREEPLSEMVSRLVCAARLDRPD